MFLLKYILELRKLSFFLQVSGIKYFVSCVLYLVSCVLSVNAQVVTPALTGAQAKALVGNVLVGTGVTIIAGSIKYTGQFVDTSKTLGITGGQIGSFTGFSKTNLGIDKGIIMSNGDVSRADKSNTPTSASTDHFNYYCTNCEEKKGDINCNNLTNAVCWNGDSDLAAIAGVADNLTYDACSLEFDFIPSSSQINFKYVFASDEYPVYVCGTTNDVFAFLVTGPNPSGPAYNKTNIALVPGTTPAEFVSINTINSGVCGKGLKPHAGVDLKNSMYYVNNANGKTIVYDAFTTVLTSTLNVVPCQQYHIKLAIADVWDPTFDSSVFLEAKSFNVLRPTIVYQNSDSTSVYKGCGSAKITFNTPNGNGVQADSTINISFVGGTAVNGTDFTTVPAGITNTITMPKGTNSYSFTINPLCKQLGTNLYVLFNVLTCGIAATDTIWIKDVPPITATPSPDDTICAGQSTTLSLTNVQGGVGAPYTYSWTSNPAGFTSAIANPVVTPAVNTTYTVVITDICSVCGPDTLKITVTVNQPVVNISAAGPTTFCNGDSVVMNANAATFTTYQWQNLGVNLNGQTNSLYTDKATGDFTVIISDRHGCTATSNDIAVTIGNPTATLTPEGPTSFCLGNSVVLDANVSAGYLYQWSKNGAVIIGATNTSLTVDSAGTYSFNMSKGVNCTANSNVEIVTVNPDPVAVIIPHGPFTVCSDSAVSLSANLDPNLTYQWQKNGQNQSGATNNTFIFTNVGYYTVVESDNIGCIGRDSIWVALKCPSTVLITPNAFTPGNNLLNTNFLPQGKNISVFSMDIYNRLGSKVFHTDDINIGWDGRFNGSPCALGVYVYFIKYEGYIDNHYEKKTQLGTITLIR